MSMRKIGLALLLTPALACASPVSIEWSGVIDQNNSSLPAPLSNLQASGVMTIDPASLPAPDAPGVSSWSNGSFLTSSVTWQFGTFVAAPVPGVQTDSLSIDPNGLCQVLTVGYSMDGSNNTIVGVMGLQFAGFSSQLLQLLSGGSGAFGGSLSDPNDGAAYGQTVGDSQGFFAQVNLESVKLESTPVAAPEVNTEGAATALSLFGFALAVARGRRRRLEGVRS